MKDNTVAYMWQAWALGLLTGLMLGVIAAIIYYWH